MGLLLDVDIKSYKETADSKYIIGPHISTSQYTNYTRIPFTDTNAATQYFVTESAIQNLDNKTLYNPIIRNQAGSQYILPAIAADDTVVLTNAQQEISNKTITNASISDMTAIDLHASQITDNNQVYLVGPHLIDVNDTLNYTRFPFSNTNSKVHYIVSTDATQTLTNKTISNPTLKQNNFTLSLPSKAGTLATTDDLTEATSPLAQAKDVADIATDVLTNAKNIASITSSLKTLMADIEGVTGGVIAGTASGAITASFGTIFGAILNHSTSGQSESEVNKAIKRALQPYAEVEYVDDEITKIKNNYVANSTLSSYVTKSGHQTLYNKTIASPTISDPSILVNETVSTTTTDPTTGAETTTTTTVPHSVVLPAQGGTLATTDGEETISNKTYEGTTTGNYISFPIKSASADTIYRVLIPNNTSPAYVLTSSAEMNMSNKRLASSNKIVNGSLLSKSGHAITFPDKVCTLATTDDINAIDPAGNMLVYDIFYLCPYFRIRWGATSQKWEYQLTFSKYPSSSINYLKCLNVLTRVRFLDCDTTEYSLDDAYEQINYTLPKSDGSEEMITTDWTVFKSNYVQNSMEEGKRYRVQYTITNTDKTEVKQTSNSNSAVAWTMPLKSNDWSAWFTVDSYYFGYKDSFSFIKFIYNGSKTISINMPDKIAQFTNSSKYLITDEELQEKYDELNTRLLAVENLLGLSNTGS